MSSRTRPWLNDAVRERRVVNRHDVARADDAGAARDAARVRARDRRRLPAPRLLAGRERRRQQVVDAELRFRDDLGRQARVRVADERVRHAYGERRGGGGGGSIGSGHGGIARQPRISTPAHSS